MQLKFAFIAACFVIAIVSFFFCKDKRDWLWLCSGLLFTVAADYFLVLRNSHLPGVAVFSFVHVWYILRALGQQWALPCASTVRPLGYTQAAAEPPHLCASQRFTRQMRRAKPIAALTPLHSAWLIKLVGVTVVSVVVFIAYRRESLIALGGIYALLFIANIAVSSRFFKKNKALVLTGLILFALCDINVLIFNLPQFGVDINFPWAFTLIWVFYLPAQLLLAVSAVDWSKAKE